MKRFISIFICLLLLPCFALADLTVYFLDVDQGDCAIIVCDNEAMIIDGGLPGKSDKVYSFIKDLHFSQFQYVVATHPDNDHIGGLPAVFRALKDLNKKAQRVYSPIKELDTPRFNDLKNKVNESGLKIEVPHDEDVKYLGNATVTFYNCGQEKKNILHATTDLIKEIFRRDEPEEDEDNNNMSLVIKIEYGDTSFLFAGDIEEEAEADLISSGVDLKANVLKVAHHGSDSSSSIDFLSKVDPQYAVISCGKGNHYGHPKQETLNEISSFSGSANSAIELYRTDLQGTITCKSDGKTITFETEKKTQEDLFKAPEK